MPATQLTRAERHALIDLALTDPANAQNTAAKLRGVLHTEVESSYSRPDDALNTGSTPKPYVLPAPNFRLGYMHTYRFRTRAEADVSYDGEVLTDLDYKNLFVYARVIVESYRNDPSNLSEVPHYQELVAVFDGNAPANRQGWRTAGGAVGGACGLKLVAAGSPEAVHGAVIRRYSNTITDWQQGELVVYADASGTDQFVTAKQNATAAFPGPTAVETTYWKPAAKPLPTAQNANEQPSLSKSVEYRTRAEQQQFAPDNPTGTVMSELKPATMALGTLIYAANVPQGESAMYQVVYDGAGTLHVWVDGTFGASGRGLIPAKLVPFGVAASGNVTPAAPSWGTLTSDRKLPLTHATLAASELEYKQGTTGTYVAYPAGGVQFDNSAHAAGELQGRVKAAPGRNVSAADGSPAVAAANTLLYQFLSDGDSLEGHGDGSGDPADLTDFYADLRWTAVLKNRLSTAYGDFRNYGKSGQTEADMLSDYQTQVLPLRDPITYPTRQTLFDGGGINSLALAGLTAQQLYDQKKQYILGAKAQGWTVVTATLTPVAQNLSSQYYTTDQLNSQINTFNNLVRSRQVDMGYDGLIDWAADQRLQNPASYTSAGSPYKDGVHFLQLGNNIKAEIAQPVIEALAANGYLQYTSPTDPYADSLYANSDFNMVADGTGTTGWLLGDGSATQVSVPGDGRAYFDHAYGQTGKLMEQRTMAVGQRYKIGVADVQVTAGQTGKLWLINSSGTEGGAPGFVFRSADGSVVKNWLVFTQTQTSSTLALSGYDGFTGSVGAFYLIPTTEPEGSGV